MWLSGAHTPQHRLPPLHQTEVIQEIRDKMQEIPWEIQEIRDKMKIWGLGGLEGHFYCKYY